MFDTVNNAAVNTGCVYLCELCFVWVYAHEEDCRIIWHFYF